MSAVPENGELVSSIFLLLFDYLTPKAGLADLNTTVPAFCLQLFHRKKKKNFFVLRGN